MSRGEPRQRGQGGHVTVRAGLALVAICGLLTACGGARSARARTGASIFAAECGACHSLVGMNSPRLQGGDLRGYRFSHQAMLEFAREMPVPHRLDTSDLHSVVDYVLGVERRGRKAP